MQLRGLEVPERMPQHAASIGHSHVLDPKLRDFEGMRAAGHMGYDRVTVHNLKIVRVDGDNHLLLIKGAVPGPRNGIVLIRKARKAKPVRVPQVETKKGKK